MAAAEGQRSGPLGEHEVASVEIVSDPGAWEGCPASNMLDGSYDSVWLSVDGQIRDQVFVLKLPEEETVTRFEWRGRGDDADVARISLQAQIGEEWMKVSAFESERRSKWQRYSLPFLARSDQWKLTFHENHGDPDLMVMNSIKIIARDGRSHSEELLGHMQADRDFADVSVVVGEARIPAHRIVLAAASPVLATMMTAGMKEAQEREIVIEDAEETAVRQALDYIYTGEISPHVGFGAVYLGHKYEIKGLVSGAALRALVNITPEKLVAEGHILKLLREDPNLLPVWELLIHKVLGDHELGRAALVALWA